MLAARAPGATVWAVDVNERALALCAANAASAGLSNVALRDARLGEIPARLAGIWSNPPVRIGKGPLHAMLRDWLGRLAPEAAATLVMGRNLGADSLHAWLEKEEGWPVTAAGRAQRLPAAAGDAPDEDPKRHAMKQTARWTLMTTDMSRRRRLRAAYAAADAARRDVKRLNREWRRRTEGRLALLLDSVSQPFNVGSIVRSAAAFGVESVWLCGNTPDLDLPAVGKTALGTDRFLAAYREPSPAAAAKAAAEDGFRVVAVESRRARCRCSRRPSTATSAWRSATRTTAARPPCSPPSRGGLHPPGRPGRLAERRGRRRHRPRRGPPPRMALAAVGGPPCGGAPMARPHRIGRLLLIGAGSGHRHFSFSS